jgi:hypothetical protein
MLPTEAPAFHSLRMPTVLNDELLNPHLMRVAVAILNHTLLHLITTDSHVAPPFG